MSISRAVISTWVEGSCYPLERRPMSLRLKILPVLLGMSLLAFLTSGCAVNPVSGRSEVVLISAEKEKELGAQEAEELKTSMGLVDDPEIVAYVKRWGVVLPNTHPERM